MISWFEAFNENIDEIGGGVEVLFVETLLEKTKYKTNTRNPNASCGFDTKNSADKWIKVINSIIL